MERWGGRSRSRARGRASESGRGRGAWRGGPRREREGGGAAHHAEAPQVDLARVGRLAQDLGRRIAHRALGRAHHRGRARLVGLGGEGAAQPEVRDLARHVVVARGEQDVLGPAGWRVAAPQRWGRRRRAQTAAASFPAAQAALGSAQERPGALKPPGGMGAMLS